MTVIVTLRGHMGSLELQEDYMETATRMQFAAVQGKEFVGSTTTDGRNILIKMDNILTIEEKDEETTF